jgi:hypothetical protein
MTETEYAQELRGASVVENNSMMAAYGEGGQGGVSNRVPKEYLKALSALKKKGMLTGSDLANMLGVSQPRGKFLLGFLERKGLARSEYHREGKLRIFFYRQTNE